MPSSAARSPLDRARLGGAPIHPPGVRCSSAACRRCAGPLGLNGMGRTDRRRYAQAIPPSQRLKASRSVRIVKPAPQTAARQASPRRAVGPRSGVVGYGPDVDLQRRIIEGQGEFLLFALTPPRQTASPGKAQEIADITAKRLQPLGVDGLILYDIDDESDRNPEERPFPFLPTMDPADYLSRYLNDWNTPVVVYRAVGKYAESELESWLRAQEPDRRLSVFVGAASRDKPVATSLGRAQMLRTQARPDLLLGGVAIPERHTRNGDEHVRLLRKQAAGCSFFVTQVVYDVNAAKNLVSDYRYDCLARGLTPVPIVFTFSVCGSMKTLEFLRWLGVDVPRWIENELLHADDTLEASFEYALAAARELITYCRRVGVPFGLNIESVSIRRAEIEASVDLAAQLRDELHRAD
jgi:Methylenetetrahydrofolate reductase